MMFKQTIALLCLALLMGGGNQVSAQAPKDIMPREAKSVHMSIPIPIATGECVNRNNEAEIDYSNISDGYIMIRYLKPTELELRILVTTPNNKVYTYRIEPDSEFHIFSLTEGDGKYEIGIFKQINKFESTKYTPVLRQTIQVRLNHEHAPFLIPSNYISFSNNSLFLEMTSRLKGIDDERAAIHEINKFVVGSIKYDKIQARDTDCWYIPDLDRAYTELTGICSDYAVLMTAMVRSIGIPARMVTGYTKDGFHAWIEVHIESTGWERRDPTIEATGKIKRNSRSYISNDENYAPMFNY